MTAHKGPKHVADYNCVCDGNAAGLGVNELVGLVNINKLVLTVCWQTAGGVRYMNWQNSRFSDDDSNLKPPVCHRQSGTCISSMGNWEKARYL
jgi:hypothetical protein